MADKNGMATQTRLFARLLTPSWSSVGLSALLAILVMGRLALEQVRSGLGPGATVLQTIADSNDSLVAAHSFTTTSTALQDVPVFALWACVGAVVYFFVADTARHIGEVSSLKRELNYVHADRQALAREFAERLGVRVAGLAMLFLSFMLMLKTTLPYALGAATALGAGVSASSILYALIGLVILVLSLHFAVVAVRLLLLRPRVFGAEA